MFLVYFGIKYLKSTSSCEFLFDMGFKEVMDSAIIRVYSAHLMNFLMPFQIICWLNAIQNCYCIDLPSGAQRLRKRSNSF